MPPLTPDPGNDLLETTRRNFLRSLGLSAASLAACQRLPVEHALPYLVAPEEIVPGVPLHFASTCMACDAGCGLVARVLDGRPVKLEGNPAHPRSRGGLCAVGQAQLRSLYDPGRLQGPLLRGEPAAWQQLDAWVRDGLGTVGRGPLWVVSRTICSPAARRAVEAFVQAHGGRWLQHDLDPQAPAALLAAYDLLDGTPAAPAWSLQATDLLVSFAADPLGTGADPVAHAADWAARRRASAQRGPLRHQPNEGSLSLTGAGADDRWPASAGQRRQMALWLLRQVAEASSGALAVDVVTALATLPPPETYGDQLRDLAADLLAHPGRSLILSAANDRSEQLALALANRLLGNEGHTLHPGASRAAGGSDTELGEFLQALEAGTVGAVVIVDLDLAGRLRRGTEIAAALARVPTSVGIFRRPCATSAACTAVVAAHHSLEGWHDAEPQGGVRTLAQPAVRPLFDTRHPYESFLAWSGTAPASWREHVRQGWDGAADWTEVVRTSGLSTLAAASAAPLATAGGAPATATEPTLAAPAAQVLLAGAAGPFASPGQLEIELIAQVSTRGGEHAGNPWLRELPDPLTRVSWSASARVAPERAAQLGIDNGDEIEVSTDAGSVVLPVVVLPGQHPDVVALPLGCGDGTSAADCDARGDRIAALLDMDGSGLLRFAGTAAAVTPTGVHSVLPRMQSTMDAQDRPIIHQVASYDEAVHAPHHPEANLWPERPPGTPHWHMVIDLDACLGCGGCVIACQAENNIPVVGPTRIAEHRDMHWLRIDRYFAGEGAPPDVLFEPMLCAQCDHAPCETVCPVAATVHSEDGLNQQVYNRCVGTRYCANNCPYKVRRFNWFNFQPTDEVERLVLNPDVVVRSRGVMEKCTFCVQRIQSARIASRRDGVAFEVATACQQSCPTQAIRFGDDSDPAGDIAAMRNQGRAFQVLAELGVRPSITYLARVRSRAGAGVPEGEHAAPAPPHGADA